MLRAAWLMLAAKRCKRRKGICGRQRSWWWRGTARVGRTPLPQRSRVAFACTAPVPQPGRVRRAAVLASERLVFYRETGSKMYAPLPYALALVSMGAPGRAPLPALGAPSADQS